MFETADEHERAVSSYGQGKTSGHAIPCASCGDWFRTTDWPPAICPACRGLGTGRGDRGAPEATGE